MLREYILPESNEHWLSLREKDLTSTMTAALFGMTPYTTKFELFHAKKNGLDLSIGSNDRMEKGKRIEEYAAQEVCLKKGWTLIGRIKEYIRLTEYNIGSSFDFLVHCPQRGYGILEIKAVDPDKHRDKWLHDEAPEHIEFQLQHQLLVHGVCSWGAIAAFTTIYDFYVYERDADEDFGQAILSKTVEFWKDVHAGNEPPPIFERDGWAIQKIYQGRAAPADMTRDEQFNALASKKLRLDDEYKLVKSEREKTAAQIHYMIGDAGFAYGQQYKVQANTTEGFQGTLIVPEMVGQRFGAKSGYRQCKVTDMNKGNKHD